MKSRLPKNSPHLIKRKTYLEEVQETKFLGLIVNQHLSWTSHMKHLLTKIRSGFGAVCRVKPFLNQNTLLQLYHSLINSHLQYCITNWCHGSKTLLDKLQKTCNRFIKMIFNIKNSKLIHKTMTEHKILTIKQLLKKNIAIFMFKQNKDLNPVAFNNIFSTNNSNYNTRSNSQIVVKQCTTKLSQQSISAIGPSVWNALNPNLKNTKQTTKSFTKNLTNYLLSQQEHN